MKNDLIRVAGVVFLSGSLLLGCGAREQAAGPNADDTATIAPAQAKPAPTGNEAMTQTVDIEDGRSDAEGASITDPEPGTPQPTSTATATDTAPATGAAAVAKGKNAPPVPRNRTQ